MPDAPWWDRLEGRLATVVGGLGIWVAAATAQRPDWAPWWSGWALSIFGIALAAFGVIRVLLMGRRPAARPANRTTLGELLAEGHRKYEDVKDLDASTPRADQRGEALRLWSERWEHRVEMAFGDDAQDRAAFARDVDTSQMHYRRAPVHRLAVKLDRLQHYMGHQFLADAVMAGEQSDDNAAINKLNSLRDEIDTAWSIFGNTGTWDSDSQWCQSKFGELIDRARALIRDHRPAYSRDLDEILRRPGRTSAVVLESADYRTSLELVRRLIDTILDAEKGIVPGGSRRGGGVQTSSRPLNTPIRVIGQPWESVGRPGFVEVLAAVPRRAPPAVGSTVSVLDSRYRVLGVSPAQDPSAHLDGMEVLVRLDLEDERLEST